MVQKLSMWKKKIILGVILSDNLKWNAHIGEIVRKSNKRLFFLRLLKNACPNREDLVVTYTSLVRPIVEYGYPVWHAGLPQYLQKEVETTQKRALTTIYGLAPYEEHLCASGLVCLKHRRVKICSGLFNEMCKPDHKLNHLIPKTHESSKSLRNAPPIDPPKFRTNRYRYTFIPYALMNFQ